jgi:tetratricopeptide (TPR) repeat protein
MSGYMQMDMGDLEKSKMYFDAALQYYPYSANVHDSMADYYVAVGALDQALQEVIRANELAPSDYYLERIIELKK